MKAKNRSRIRWETKIALTYPNHWRVSLNNIGTPIENDHFTWKVLMCYAMSVDKTCNVGS